MSQTGVLRVVILILFFGIAVAAISESIEEKANIMANDTYATRLDLLRRMSPQDRVGVAELLYKQLLSAPPEDQMPLRRGLALMGDAEAIKHLVREFIDNDSGGLGELARLRNPRIIEMLVPELFREQSNKRFGDFIVLSSSLRAATVTLRLLESSPGFTDEVREWSRKLLRLTPGEQRGLVRQWWKENEAAMRSEKYVIVKPGPAPTRVPVDVLVPTVPSEIPPNASANTVGNPDPPTNPTGNKE